VIRARLNPKELGKLLRKVRHAANVTQADLAERLGVPYQNISRLEAGAREGMISTINRYVRVLGWELVLIARPRKPRGEPEQPSEHGVDDESE
jgi:transcriptional regulator with XRE-family HTH domain